MTDFEVKSGAATLTGSIWGDGASSIVALHPGIGDRRIWQWCAPVWAEAGHRVVAYDRRGFGDTVAPAEVHDDVVDLRAVTSATESRPAVLVGNSRGGSLALDLALAHPDDVVAIVLIGSGPSGYDYSDWPTAPAEAEQDDLIAAADAAMDLDLVNRLEVRYWLDGVDQSEGRVSDPARDLMIDMNGRALFHAPIGAPAERPTAAPRLGEIVVPVLVIVGEYDLPGVRRQGEQLAAALPAATFTSIAGSAHCPSLDQPRELSRVVLDFLAPLTGPSTTAPTGAPA